MDTPRTRIGHNAELAAESELIRQGYTIIESNWRCKSGEIDRIAKDKGTLVFVEVRYKKNFNFGTPAETIDLKKQKKIISAAKLYLLKNKLQDSDCRFDVVEVTLVKGLFNVTQIIKDAFWS
jgi:putative endonuclease